MEEDRKVYMFDGTNFANWSFRMEVHLEELGLLPCIQQTPEEVAEFRVLAADSAEVKLAKEKGLAERKTRDIRCKSVLIRNIADSQLEYVKQKRNAMEIWQALQNAFARKGISGQFFLLKKLSALKYDETGTMEQHLLLFGKTVRDLDSAGIKMDERLIVFHLLQSMPRSYCQLVTVLETLSEEQCTLDFVRARLLNESVKRANSDDVEDGASTAFAGKGKKSKNKFKCYICGKVGHKQVDCPNRDEEKPRSSKKSANKGNAHVSEKEVVFVSHSVGEKANDSRSDVSWILDSGASDHMVGTIDWLRDVKRLDKPVLIKVASGQTLESNHSGYVDIVSKIGRKRLNSVVSEVLYVPGLRYNLFSIQRVGQLGMEVVFGKNSAEILRNGEVVCTGKRKDKLYELNVEVSRVKEPAALVSQNTISNEELWHRRFGHIGKSGLVKMVDTGMVNGLMLKKSEIVERAVCEPCLKGKQTRKPFTDMPLPRSSRPLELVHSDVCGAMTPTAFNGKRYFVSFMDDFSHFTAVYMLSTKDEVMEAFETYAAMAESHFDSRISRLRCDNGGEYVGAAFRDFCRVRGIQLEYTVPYTPQQNGVSERFNRTVMEKARAMIEDAGMSKALWCEAVLAAVYVINRSPTAALTTNKTPYEMWYGHKPDVSKFRIFGARAFSFVPKEKRNKLESRSKSCHFVGYGVNGYRLWDGRKVFVARDVVVEELPLSSNKVEAQTVPKRSSSGVELAGPSSGSLVGPSSSSLADPPGGPADVPPVGPPVISPADPPVVPPASPPAVPPAGPPVPPTGPPVVPPVSPPVVPPGGRRVVSPVGPSSSSVVSPGRGTPARFPAVPLPPATAEAVAEQLEAVDVFEEEFSDCLDDDTDMEEYEQDPLGLRRSQRNRKPPAWLSHYSHVAFALNAESYVGNVPESIEELKLQPDWPEWKEAIDEELKSLAENETWQLVELPSGRKPVDCKWVFRLKTDPDGAIIKRKARLVAKGFTQRYGFDFSETYSPVVRMSTVRMMLALANQFNLFVHQMDVKAAFLNGQLSEDIYMRQPKGFEEGSMVCKLSKSIYGLKQASKAWNERFNEFAARNGFRRCSEDSCLYVLDSDAGPVYLLLYVDDVLIICKDLAMVQKVKAMLQREFRMVDLGEAQMFLGIRIERNVSKGVMKLSQPGYTEAVLRRFGMESCKPASTPMCANLQLQRPEVQQNLEKPYRELIGCLTYLMVTSRPDLSSAVSYFSQFQCNPSQEHWSHLKRILRYLRGSTQQGLIYNRQKLADQIVGFVDANWATDAGDRHSISGHVFQIYGSTTSWSTKKQKTIALSSTESECSALADCICEALWINKLFEDLRLRSNQAVVIYEDNQSAIAIAESDAPSRKLKHTEVKLQFIKECVQKKKVTVRFRPSGDQPADLLTKGLPPVTFKKHCLSLGIQQ